MSAIPDPAPVRAGKVTFGGGAPLALIAGPCVIESDRHARFMAQSLRDLMGELDLPFVFKASYDKANRSSYDNPRGPGRDEGLAILAGIRSEFDVPVTSDIHTPEDAAAVGDRLDIVQVPAFLCRQTDLLIAAGRTGKVVNVKKGQFAAPDDMKNVLTKVHVGGAGGVLLTERGTTFGYHDLVVDMRSLPRMRALGAPVVFDATHSVQSPGGLGGRSGGDRRLAPALARAAVAAGIDGLFLEVHDQPDEALCDGPNMIPLAELKKLLIAVKAIDRAVRGG